jgi:hypothetical protein
MKTCSTSLRQNAYKIYKGECASEKDKVVLDKFFRYLEAYCAEMKCTELDIFLNDKNWESVFHLFESIMLKPEKVLL